MEGMDFTRRCLFGAALALVAAGSPTFAQAGSPAPAQAGSTASAQDDAAAVAPIKRLVDGLRQVMRQGGTVPFEQRFDTLAPVIDQTFDLATILQQSVGLAWQALPPQQQDRLRSAFRRYTVASYVNSFDSLDGERFEIAPATRIIGNGERVVQTRIIPRNGDSHTLDYVMRQGPGGWRVVDVLADGAISRVAVQRSDFRRLLSRGGATALAETLQQKTANLTRETS